MYQGLLLRSHHMGCAKNVCSLLWHQAGLSGNCCPHIPYEREDGGGGGHKLFLLLICRGVHTSTFCSGVPMCGFCCTLVMPRTGVCAYSCLLCSGVARASPSSNSLPCPPRPLHPCPCRFVGLHVRPCICLHTVLLMLSDAEV